MKFLARCLVFAVICSTASAEKMSIRDAAGWVQVGRNCFDRCEFKDAARAFSNAVRQSPADADLYHWLGKSYARMAEVSSSLYASKNGRKARGSLERAVELAPVNQQYLRDLFDFYLDSPEWFGGGLEKAALLVERIAPGDPGAQALLRTLVAEARQEYRGPTWRLRQATLLPPGQLGRIVP